MNELHEEDEQPCYLECYLKHHIRGKVDNESKLIPIEAIPTSNNSNDSDDSRDQSNESEPQLNPEYIPQTKRHSITHDENSIKSKKQRIGPSYDLCRSKKIKCDAHVENIIEQLDINPDDFHELTKTNETIECK
ncbi:hypothetical protein BN7_586 [Wickerhamomyces ciferrii]|uniref:Uncharacterized protein n=1 Tax=Wickerhamomyces ciferrii (strain ATCC 14091 / BCRC 22168 / CBS 111 / JCM 3599 / NBRC 0793 / NRRL Y-1031 F-60-10) TaxID=1206466 RepID=K0KI10_WICCF|nr:uncharacterized protein BN7_586 [Wickerhamomyces ciferrii]CCH41049.1 hypothetical protein BN7_586 [Wickerhamomyces ciferrii]